MEDCPQILRGYREGGENNTENNVMKQTHFGQDADETICKLAAAARRTMQERDELRSQGKILLSELQARNTHMMLAGTTYPKPARPDAFAIHSYNRALLPNPTRAKPFAGMYQGRDSQAGCSYRFATPSSSFGHKNTAVCSLSPIPAMPSSHDLTCSSQDDSFDPDMFLVDPSESQQDFARATSSSDLGDNKWCI
ncbi:hypothetical protein ABZP36_006041 [Zizania latifolia]